MDPNIIGIPSAEEILQYFHLAGFALIGLGALFGLMRGVYKTTFYFLWTVVILVGGWFLMPLVTGMLMSIDISAFYALSVQGIPLTTINEFVPNYVISMVPQLENMMIEGSATLELVMAFAQMAINIVFIILLFVLLGTVFKVISWIVWLIIRPKKRMVNGKMRRPKKGFVGRLSGAVVGAIQAAFLIMLSAIPLSGLMSIGSSLVDVIENIDQAEQLFNRYKIVVYEDYVLLLDNPVEDENPFGPYEDFFKIFKGYRETSIGMIAGIIKIGETPIDEYIFDDIFSVTVGEAEEEVQLKFREELQTIASAFGKLMQATNGSGQINQDTLLSLTKEEITEIFTDLASLKIIQVVIPVGIEYIVNSGEFDELLGDLKDEFTLESLRQIDFVGDIMKIGDILADAVTLFDPDTPFDQVDFFAFNAETITQIFSTVGSMGIIQYAAPLAFNLLLDGEGLIAFFDEYEIDRTSIVLPTGDQWQVEFAQIGTIYGALQELGVTMDLINGGDEDALMTFFENLEEEDIEAFVNAIFDLQLVSSNTEVAGKVIFATIQGILPEELKGIISLENITSSFNAQEITNLLLLGQVIISSGILSEGFDLNMLLTDENIEKLILYITSSTLITQNVSAIINSLLGSLDFGFELVFPDDIDWASDAGKDELRAILYGAKEIFDAGLLEGEFDISELSDDVIDRIALRLSQSRIIRENLNPIIDMFIGNIDLEFTIALPESPDEWTYTELRSLLKAAKILMALGGDVNAIFSLSDEDINAFLASKIISRTLVSALETYTAPERIDGTEVIPAGMLYDILIIDGITNPNDWYDVYEEDVRIKSGELRKLLESIKLILGDDFDFNDTSNFDINNIINLSDGETDPEDDDIRQLLSSIILRDTLIHLIVKFSEPGGETAAPLVVNLTREDPLWLDEYDVDGLRTRVGELRKILRSLGIIFADGVDMDNIEFDFNTFLDLSDEDIHFISTSIIFADTAAELITDMTAEGESLDGIIVIPEGLVWISTDTEQGELERIILAIRILIEPDQAFDDLNFDSIDKLFAFDAQGNEIPGGKENQDTLLASSIIRSTIIKLIEDEANKVDPMIVIPEDVDWNVELYRLLDALSVLIPDGIISNMDINLSNMYLQRDINGDVLPNGSYGQDTVFASVVFTASIVNMIEKQAEDEDMIVIPSDDPAFDWYDTYDGEGIKTADGELRKLINALEIFLPDGDFDNLDFDLSKLYARDANGDELSGGQDRQDTVLASMILKESIIYQVEKEATGVDPMIVIPDDVDWDVELYRLLDALSVLIPGGDIEGIDINLSNMYIKRDLEGAPLPNGSYGQDTVLASVIFTASIVNIIEKEAENEDMIVIPSDDPTFDWYDTYDGDGLKLTDGELRKLINALEIFLPDGNFENLDFDLSKLYARDANGDAIDGGQERQDTVLASMILKESIIYQVEKEADAVDPMIVIPDGVDWDVELYRLLDALSVLIPDGNIEGIDINLSNLYIKRDVDGDPLPNGSYGQDTVLASVVFTASIINMIEKEAADGDMIVIPSEDPSFDWYDTYNIDGIKTQDGELRKLINALEIFLPEGDINLIDFDLSKLYAKDAIGTPISGGQDRQDTVLASMVIVESIIKQVKNEAYDAITNPTGNLVVPADDDPDFPGFTWYGSEGELLKVINALSVLIPDGNIDSIDVDLSKVYKDTVTEDYGQTTVLASAIISKTIVKKIMEEADAVGSMIVVPVDVSWYGAEGELVKLIDALEVFAPTGVIDNLDVDLSKLYAKNPDGTDIVGGAARQATVLASSVITESIIKQIKDEAYDAIDNPTGNLVIPEDGDLEFPDFTWYGSEGELKKVINALSVLIPTGNIESIDVDLSLVYKNDATSDYEQTTILASAIISKTIVKQIMDEADKVGSMIIVPNDVSWYGTEGELVKLIDALEVFVPTGNIDNLDVDISKLYAKNPDGTDIVGGAERQATVLASSVIAASIIKQIEDEAYDPVDNPTGNLIIPADDDPDFPDFTWTGNDGELVRIINALSVLVPTGNLTGFDVNISDIYKDAVTENYAQNTVLASIIISKSIVKQIEDEAANPTSMLVVPNDVVWYGATGELVSLIDALEVFAPTGVIDNIDVDISKLYAKNPDGTDIIGGAARQATVLASSVIAASIIKQIEDEAYDPVDNPTGNLVIPADGDLDFPDFAWTGNDGELVRIINALSVLVPTGNLTGFDVNISDVYKDTATGNYAQNTVLASAVISKSIVKQIEDEANAPASMIIIPNDVSWYGTEGELVSLIDALEVFAPTGVIDNLDVDISKLYAKNPDGTDIIGGAERQALLLGSSVIAASIIKQIEDEAYDPIDNPTGNLVVPADGDPDFPDFAWTGNDGELVKIINALSVLVPTGNLTGFDVDLSDVYKDAPTENYAQNTVLASAVISKSIVKQIEDEAANPTSMLVVPVDVVWYGATGELVSLIDALEVFAPTGVIDNLDVDISKLYAKNPDGSAIAGGAERQALLLASGVITASIIKQIEDEAYDPVDNPMGNLVVPSDSDPDFPDFAWTGNDGELVKILNALSVLVPTGDLTGFDVDISAVYKDAATENYAQNTVLASAVISKSIVKQIEDESDAPGSMIKIPEDPAFTWYGPTGDLVQILDALAEIVPSGNIAGLNLDIGQVLDKDFNIILGSKVIEHSIVLVAKDLITTGDLQNFVEPKYPDNSDYDWYKNVNPANMTGDLQPLLEVLRDMGSPEFGIDYTNITYTSMLSAVSTDQKAEDLSALLLSSNIIENSLDKMFTTVLGQGGFDETRITIDSSGDPTFWRGNPDLGIEGELVLFLKGLNSLNAFDGLNYNTIDNTNDTGLRTTLKTINKSSILRQILGEFVDDGLSSASAWKDPNADPKALTKEEWDEEIDVLVDMLVLINDPTKSVNLNNSDVATMSDTQADNFGEMLKLVARSRLLDISVLSDYMFDGIKAVFSGTVFTSEPGEVSSYPNPDDYATKVTKWDTEIDKLVIIIKKLNAISPLDLNKIKDDYNYAVAMGEFFDAVKVSVMLSPLMDDLLKSVMSQSVYDAFGPFDENTNYVQVFIDIHNFLNLPVPPGF